MDAAARALGAGPALDVAQPDRAAGGVSLEIAGEVPHLDPAAGCVELRGGARARERNTATGGMNRNLGLRGHLDLEADVGAAVEEPVGKPMALSRDDRDAAGPFLEIEAEQVVEVAAGSHENADARSGCPRDRDAPHVRIDREFASCFELEGLLHPRLGQGRPGGQSQHDEAIKRAKQSGLHDTSPLFIPLNAETRRGFCYLSSRKIVMPRPESVTRSGSIRSTVKSSAMPPVSSTRPLITATGRVSE